MTPCRLHADVRSDCPECRGTAVEPAPCNTGDHLVEELRAHGFRCNRGKRHYTNTVTVRGAFNDHEFQLIKRVVKRVVTESVVERPSNAYVSVRW